MPPGVMPPCPNGLGWAIIVLASLLTKTRLSEPLRYAGSKSIAIYLTFFLPMAFMRVLLLKTDLGTIEDINKYLNKVMERRGKRAAVPRDPNNGPPLTAIPLHLYGFPLQ